MNTHEKTTRGREMRVHVIFYLFGCARSLLKFLIWSLRDMSSEWNIRIKLNIKI